MGGSPQWREAYRETPEADACAKRGRDGRESTSRLTGSSGTMGPKGAASSSAPVLGAAACECVWGAFEGCGSLT